MQAKELLNKYLIENNLRQTPERYIILKYIYKISTHFDIDFLYNCINKKEKISKATIYNNLQILTKAKLIKKTNFNDNKILYEKSLNKKQHDHLICITCGKIMEFCDPRIKNILDGIEKITEFQVDNHSLNVYGKCENKKCKI
ncbi:MAG: transcriptional repressor [Flavobacteriales bacterium]|nr:transcriptional repressor [Flavobacteriales bacterium]|tara:strand:+ start:337 stop:765 length:429 start_codon:yes stop_codon:yes gene_type:complete